MVADNATIRTPEITTEERIEMRTALIGENAQNALDFQNRAVRKFGPAAGIFIRQLVFWDTRGVSEDDFIYKSRSEMHEETGLNQKQQQKARRALVAAGVLEEEERPVGPLKRRTMHYRPNLGNLMELLHPAESAPEPEPVETPTEVEAGKHVEAAVEEFYELPDFEMCFECGATEGHWASCSLSVEPEPDGYEDDFVPEYSDHDAPEESAPVDWLPDDFEAQSPLVSYMKPYSESRTRTPIATHVPETLKRLTYPNPYSDSGIQESTFTRERHVVTESSSLQAQNSPCDAPPAAPPARGDQVNQEGMSTTSTRSAPDSFDGKGTEGKVSTIPTETTKPMKRA